MNKDLGRRWAKADLQRACRNGCQPPSELSGSYRFDQPITDHNRQKRCSTISARSSSPWGLTLGACGFQTEDIQTWADIAEVYLQINLEPQYSLVKEHSYVSRTFGPRGVGTPAECGRVCRGRQRQRQTGPNSFVFRRLFFSFGRITAWLRPFRQGAGVTAGRGDGLSV